MSTKKKKPQERFIIVAHDTPYVGYPEDQPSDNNLPELATNIREIKAQLKAWQEWDLEQNVEDQDEPPMEFKIYKLLEVL